MNVTCLTALKPRRISRKIFVGNIGIGGDEPIRVQTMTNTDTSDINSTVQQIIKCVNEGSELVRLTTKSVEQIKAIKAIKEVLQKEFNCDVPLIADIHNETSLAIKALEYADKIRLNPGNLIDKKRINEKGILTDEEYNKELHHIEKGLIPFIEAVSKVKKPIRIGSNHGSLSKRIIEKYGNTPKGMVESVMEYLRVFYKYNFHDIVVALKASDPLIMIEANRLLAKVMEQEKMDYPIHLGVTEAGSGEDGRAKSIIGIGTLLLEGIGDTIRVSLTEDPEKEIPVCYTILQATRRRITKAEFISCPSCGRTLYNIEKVVQIIKNRLEHLKGLHIAVMGCIINGHGEMAGADFGYVGSAPEKINLYYKETLVKRNVNENEAIDELIALIKEKGKWTEK